MSVPSNVNSVISGLNDILHKYGNPRPPSPYANRPMPWITRLAPEEETQFQQWVKTNNIPFDPSPWSDYDMRGYWKAMMSGDKNAVQAANKHFPDTYKTPYHVSFSNESMYATPEAPKWQGNKLVDRKGRVVFEEGNGE